MPLTLNEDDGYLTVTLNTGAGPLTVALDLYEANNQYATFCDLYDPTEKVIELHAAWVDWLVSKGFPPISQANGQLVVGAVLEAVAEFKKKHAPDSGTPASAGSTASPSTPAP